MAKKVVVEEKTALPVNDAWTGMLAISLLALVAACVLLYLDWSQYSGKGGADPSKYTVPAAQEKPAGDGGPGPDGGDDGKKGGPGADEGKKADADAGLKGGNGDKKGL